MVDLQPRDRSPFSNYKEILSEIHAFVTCPSILSPLDEELESLLDLDDEENVERLTDLEDEEESSKRLHNDEHDVNQPKSQRNLDDSLKSDDESCEEKSNSDEEDDELARRLDSQLFNVLMGASGSSICDSESLELSEFDSDEGEDDLDRIVDQLQNGHSSSATGEKCSMPTLSSLLTCEQPTGNVASPEPAKPSNQTKLSRKKLKIKFAQHQTKVNYTFCNESSVRLFDKIIRNNFHQKIKAAALLNSSSANGKHNKNPDPPNTSSSSISPTCSSASSNNISSDNHNEMTDQQSSKENSSEHQPSSTVIEQNVDHLDSANEKNGSKEQSTKQNDRSSEVHENEDQQSSDNAKISTDQSSIIEKCSKVQPLSASNKKKSSTDQLSKMKRKKSSNLQKSLETLDLMITEEMDITAEQACPSPCSSTSSSSTRKSKDSTSKSTRLSQQPHSFDVLSNSGGEQLMTQADEHKSKKKSRKREVLKKSKSEIFTLKSNSMNSSLESLLKSIRSK